MAKIDGNEIRVSDSVYERFDIGFGWSWPIFELRFSKDEVYKFLKEGVV